MVSETEISICKDTPIISHNLYPDDTICYFTGAPAREHSPQQPASPADSLMQCDDRAGFTIIVQTDMRSYLAVALSLAAGAA